MLNYELCIMFLVTTITNLFALPTIYIAYERGRSFLVQLGFFTLASSLMYHAIDSLNIEELYLSRQSWHKLDNIGSILCLILLFIHLMDNIEKDENGRYISINDTKIDRTLGFFGLWITLIMQANHPWHIENTVVPIVIFALLFCFKVVIIRKPRIISKYFAKGTAFFAIAMVCFYMGLDDNGDYLRLWHGAWHIFIDISLFYYFQCIDKEKPIAGITFVETSKNDNMEIYEIFRRLKKFKWNPKVNHKLLLI